MCAEYGLMQEQSTVERVLHWVHDDFASSHADSSVDSLSLSDMPLALVIVSGVVLEDTMLRCRVIMVGV